MLCSCLLVDRPRLFSSAFSVAPTSSIRRVSTQLYETSEKKGPSSKHDKKAKRLQKPPRFTQTVHRNSSSRPATGGGVQKDRMWNSRKKSIEELEEIMNKRWGTDVNTFTKDDYYDDDDDEMEGETETSSSAPTFRARPVKDPWGENDKDQQSSLFRKHDPQLEKSLQKVHKNQERVKRERTSQNQQPKHYQQQTREFYDEDDEGYESSSSTTGSLDFMIRPQPAGGKGTLNRTPAPAPASSTGGGFFFRDTSAEIDSTDDASNNEKADEPSKQTKKKPSPSKPLLDDETGEPLLLTLAQAERNFRDSLDESDSASIPSLSNLEDEESDKNLLASSQSWEDLGITDTLLLENLEDMRCDSPLSVQAKACPEVISGKDVVVGTYTGSGKTLAFLVPLAQKLLNDPEQPKGVASTRVVIVAPGRELASQIVAVARELLVDTGLTAMLAIGGTTFSRNLDQIRKRKPDTIVGTPGRLAELIVGRPGERTGRLKTAALQALVLDEFDALLEYKPHREPTMAILQTIQQRYKGNVQSVWCSATASDVLDSSKVESCLNPDFAVAMADKDDLIVTSKKTGAKKEAPRVSKTVIHGVVHVPHRRFVLDTLRRILHTEPLPQQILIFVENSRKVDLLVERMAKIGIVAAPLHGGRKSDKLDRAEVSKALREGFIGIVVATELAARGLDNPLLTHVINLGKFKDYPSNGI